MTETRGPAAPSAPTPARPRGCCHGPAALLTLSLLRGVTQQTRRAPSHTAPHMAVNYPNSGEVLVDRFDSTQPHKGKRFACIQGVLPLHCDVCLCAVSLPVRLLSACLTVCVCVSLRVWTTSPDASKRTPTTFRSRAAACWQSSLPRGTKAGSFRPPTT